MMTTAIRDRTLKALSLLLSYPTVELQRSIPEIRKLIAADRRLAGTPGRNLDAVAARMAAEDIYELEENFVTLFDRTRSLSLNLFEHVHGESRERGSAMVSLVETYRAGGFEPASSELPDHLPVLLEFLSTRPAAEAQEILADAGHIVETLRKRLAQRNSDFAHMLDAILRISKARPDKEAVAEMMRQPEGDPEDLEALDEAWEESEVTFGPDPNAGCPQAREMLSRMSAGTAAPKRPAAN